MSVTRRHTIYDIQLGKAVPIRAGAIMSSNIRTDTDARAEASSGQLYPRHVAINAINPVADWESLDLNTWLTEIGLGGVDIASFPTGVDLFAYKHLEGSGRAGNLLHRQYNMTEGLIVPTRIQCDHQGDARISYDCLPTWDGSNDPFTITDLVTVPAVASDSERLTIGPITLESTVYDHVKSVEIDFGINAEREGADSDLYPTHASIVTTAPRITLRGIDIEWLKAANIPLHGKAVTHVNTSGYFRKRTIDADGYVANGVAEHVKWTADGLAYVDDAYSAGGDGAVETSLVIICRDDGTNAPIVITPNSAIT